MTDTKKETENHRLSVADLRPLTGAGKKLYVETYGCQMNVGDSEILIAIMQREGYRYTEDIAQADVILVNTCSIRDNAEQRIWGRLREFHRYKKARKGLIVGIVGCMAERLREELLERESIVDIVAGPDSYRDMPRLVALAASGAHGVNVQLSEEETYGEIRHSSMMGTETLDAFPGVSPISFHLSTSRPDFTPQ